MTTEEQGNLFTQLSPYMHEYTILRIKELQLQNLPENKNTWQMQNELEVLKNNVVESIMDIIFDANNIEYSEIINLNSGHRKVTLLGDYGIDKEGNKFHYTKTGWKLFNPDKYETKFFKKKYQELLQIIENKNQQ